MDFTIKVEVVSDDLLVDPGLDLIRDPVLGTTVDLAGAEITVVVEVVVAEITAPAMVVAPVVMTGISSASRRRFLVSR